MSHQPDDHELGENDDPLEKLLKVVQQTNRSLATDPSETAQRMRDVSIALGALLSRVEKRAERGLTAEEMKVMAEIDLIELESAVERLKKSVAQNPPLGDGA
ncbi:MAG: hypothetical protein WD872_05080 [Pirellulaceae bacterium]